MSQHGGRSVMTSVVGALFLTVPIVAHGQSSTATVERITSRTTASAQASATKTSPAKRAAPRATMKTPWGEPDLQGIWSYATLTPLERPKAVGDREFFTDEEMQKQQAALSVDRPPRKGDPGTYNRFWFDQGRAPSRRTSQIIDPPDGRLPALTPRGQAIVARRNAWRADGYRPADWLELQTDDRCIMYHGVPPQPSGYNNTYQIFQAPGLVAILDENIHHVRLIHTDGRPHIGKNISQWNGDSVGRWEGDTLVVQTTNYHPQTELRFPQQMEGFENAVAVERFRRVDATTIDYRFTVDAPDVFTRPFTAVLPLAATEGPLFEYACHEGNHSMIGILRGARLLDEEAAKSQK